MAAKYYVIWEGRGLILIVWAVFVPWKRGEGAFPPPHGRNNAKLFLMSSMCILAIWSKLLRFFCLQEF